MFYDITDPQLRATLDDKCQRWLIEAESQHRSMYAEWNDADQYFENQQVPDGFTEAHRDALANVNDPTQGSVTNKQYVVFNKILMTHEGVLGDFINGKKTLSVSGRTPKDRKFARVMRAEMEMQQDEMMLWDEVVVPTIDCGIRRGIHWIKMWFDPTRELPYGKIMVSEISCRDVLIDPKSRKPFYTDKQYIIHRQKFLVEDANRLFAKYLGGQQFAPDRFSEDPYLYQASPSRDLTCTIYEFQFREVETRYFALVDTPESGNTQWTQTAGGDAQVQEIDEQTYNKLALNPETAQNCFMETRDVWYTCLYNRGTRTFYNAENEFGIDTLTPFINIRSEGRLYPLGSTKYDKNLQDLLNVFTSVLLDNAKRGNRGIYGVSTAAYTQFADQIIAAINGTGPNVIPTDQYKVEYPRELNPGIVQLFGMVEKALDDVQSQHGLSRGDMPRERLAEKTVNLLIQQDRASHGRKDIMIRWTLTRLAKLMFKIIQTKFSESHWARVMDTQRGDPQYIPVNQILTESEYLQMLAQMAGVELTPDTQGQDLMDANDQIKQFRKQFESENDVTKVPQPVHDINGQRFSDADYQKGIQKSGMDPAEYDQANGVEHSSINVYVINPIDKNADMHVVYEVDFNYDRDKEMKTNRAFALFDRQVITGKRLLNDLDYPDADDAWDEAMKQNQAMNLGMQIVSNPQLYQMVMQAAQALQNAPGGGGAPGGAPPPQPKPGMAAPGGNGQAAGQSPPTPSPSPQIGV